jgi:polyisoprenoid-binding protein YceI
MKHTFAVFSLFLLLLVAGPLSAQTAGWKLDKAHSSIEFSIRHLVISSVTGKFKDFDISFNSSKADFTDATVSATIKVASIDTDNERRDAHLRTDDFFNAEKYPLIKFKSTSFEKTGNDTYAIKGNLTIRDTTKSVTFDAVYNGSIKAPWGATVSSWKATLVINRFDYGLKWDKALETGGLIAGDKVTITINLELDKPSA